jgi:hypothetical protein
MKKLVLMLVVGLVSLGYREASAQFTKGDNLLNIGIGVNSYYGGGIPLGISYEHGITEDISIGAGVDYFSYRSGGSRFSATYLGFRGSYHFNNLIKHNVEELDLYAGATLGYRNFSWNDPPIPGLGDTYGSGLFLGAHVGARYYFKPSVGGFVELGAGGSGNARLGVAFKF